MHRPKVYDVGRHNRTLFIVLLLVPGVTSRASGGAAPVDAEPELVHFVDPLIGSDAHGHVFVGASVPFGGVQLGPNNLFQGWDWCSGYHYSDDVLIGFSHYHLSGTGCPDLGDVLVMPHAGDFTLQVKQRHDLEQGYASRYAHDRETARPGYYAVDLLSSGVRVELTATERAGFHRYTFPEGQQARVILDLLTGNGDEPAHATTIERRDSQTLIGRRFSRGWAKDQRAYFAMTMSTAPAEIQLFAADGSSTDNGEVASFAVLLFPPKTHELLIKVGMSAVNTTNALLNLQTEIPHWDFDQIVHEAQQRWNDALESIQIRTVDDNHKRVFYTALFHAMIAPTIFNDVNRDFRGADLKIHHDADFTNYSVLSLWDSYRAEHPLLTIVQPQRVDDFVNTMLAIFHQQGKLPIWHLMANETDTMIGYSAVPVIADAYLKGFRGFDADKALAAAKASAMRDDLGLASLKGRGYIAADQEVESVAKGLEYAIDDWCIAQMANRMGASEDHQLFAARANYYQNYFDAQTGFMRGKLADGSWRTPFDPAASTHRRDDYCEGNAWQYTWLVPHDVDGLIKLLGGPDAFAHKLDMLFELPATLGDGASADISGLIGQYAHGNEPGHHIPYLYAFAGQQWKTAARVRHIMASLYSDRPDGLCGNEDCGQMSAWYVFSALGFYPVNPAGGTYVLGSPLLAEATIRLPGGKQFQIVADNNSAENIYIQSAVLNGRPHNSAFLTHETIVAGGKLTLTLGPQPNKQFPTASSSVASRSGL